jgi:hypothetical protein
MTWPAWGGRRRGELQHELVDAEESALPAQAGAQVQRGQHELVDAEASALPSWQAGA